MTLTDDRPSAELLGQLRDGSESAAEEVFHRYMARLTRLARSRLSPRVAIRTDPEDVVLSAYRSFFVGARAGRFELRRSGDLWRLLVSMTLHKLYHRARRSRAAKRSVDLERSLTVVPERALIARDPSPDEAAATADLIESVMESLDPFARRVFELRLQDEKHSAIAEETGRSERTIRRTLDSIRKQLVARLGDTRDD